MMGWWKNLKAYCDINFSLQPATVKWGEVRVAPFVPKRSVAELKALIADAGPGGYVRLTPEEFDAIMHDELCKDVSPYAMPTVEELLGR